uniref:Uncharacterized protein n=1 Tax=Oryza brachyantha TaxID=4533 RepID=J3L4N8_ORYBR
MTCPSRSLQSLPSPTSPRPRIAITTSPKSKPLIYQSQKTPPPSRPVPVPLFALVSTAGDGRLARACRWEVEGMGCCFSKKRRKHLAGAAVFSRHCKLEDSDPPPPPLPEEEKVKEVLSETPSAKVRPEAKPVANVAVLEEPEVEKLVPKPRADAEATVSDLGSCMSLATDDRSEAASESSVATSSVAGPERSPGKPARKRPVSVSGELGHARSRRDRAVAAYGAEDDDAVTADGEPSIADAASAGGDGQGNGDGEGKESLDNPLVSLECFIFL